MRNFFCFFLLAAPFLPLQMHSQSSPVHVAGSVISRDLASQSASAGAMTAGAIAVDRVSTGAKSARAAAALQCTTPAHTVLGAITSRPVPRYRDEERVSGESVFRVVIGRDGSVKEATELAGPPARKDADLRAVLQWKFEPSKLNGEPIEVSTSIALDAEFEAMP